MKVLLGILGIVTAAVAAPKASLYVVPDGEMVHIQWSYDKGGFGKVLLERQCPGRAVESLLQEPLEFSLVADKALPHLSPDQQKRAQAAYAEEVAAAHIGGNLTAKSLSDAYNEAFGVIIFSSLLSQNFDLALYSGTALEIPGAGATCTYTLKNSSKKVLSEAKPFRPKIMDKKGWVKLPIRGRNNGWSLMWTMEMKPPTALPIAVYRKSASGWHQITWHFSQSQESEPYSILLERDSLPAKGPVEFAVVPVYIGVPLDTLEIRADNLGISNPADIPAPQVLEMRLAGDTLIWNLTSPFGDSLRVDSTSVQRWDGETQEYTTLKTIPGFLQQGRTRIAVAKRCEQDLIVEFSTPQGDWGARSYIDLCDDMRAQDLPESTVSVQWNGADSATFFWKPETKDPGFWLIDGRIQEPSVHSFGIRLSDERPEFTFRLCHAAPSPYACLNTNIRRPEEQ